MPGKRTSHQKDCSDKYTGDNNTHASHYIPAKQREYFNLPNSNDGPSNYRNVNAYTNQSVHNTIDNHLLSQSRNHSFEGGPLTTNSGTSISSREISARIEKQISVAKETGDIHNDRYRQFLYKSADAYGVDKRKFNGY